MSEIRDMDEIIDDECYFRKTDATISDIHNFIVWLNKFRFYNDRMYLYDDEYGYYVLIDRKNEWFELANFLDVELATKLLPREIKNLLDMLRLDLRLHREYDFEPFSKLINTENGVVNVITREILPHSYRFDFTSCINAEYIPDASIDDAPAFKQFCQTSLNGDFIKIKLLLQIIGYICSNYTTAKKAFMLIGKPNSGKSKIAEWLGNIIGEDNVSNVSFDKLGNRFNIAAFSRSKLNINAEMSLESIKDISMFKSLIGGDKIQAEDKGKQPFTFSNKCKFLFAGNGLPVIKSQDTTEAFISRLVILYFPNSISEAERDLELSEKLYYERDIIFSLAVNELNELVESGFRFELPQEESEQLLEYKENSTHIESFIDDRCILSPELKSSTKTLYDAYINYCKDNCFTPYGMQTFAAAIRNSRNLIKTKITVKGIQIRGFKGIDIK